MLNGFQALAQKIGVSVPKLDVVLGCGSVLQSDRLANHKCHGFGLGLAVRTTPGVVRLLGSVGDFSWPGATGTNWWADPKEDLVVVWMAATPGPMRWKYRQMINALVYQAIAD